MFVKEKKLDHVLDQYQTMVMTFACAIISHPDYPYRQEDKKRFFDDLNQTFAPNWKYEVTMLEAMRFADALMSMDD